MLSELLVVIAIMAIIAGVSFVSVSSYIRNLQTLEMDETAKEMFIAAQNHLSSAYASGEYEEELNKARKNHSDEAEFGTILTTIPAYIDEVSGDKNGEHEYRVITHTSTTTRNKILNYMLPLFAINSEVADDGNYMIVYEANSGTVLSVFYSGNPHTGFGGKSVYTFKNADVNTDAIKEAINSKAKRKNFTGDTVIGYFGGKNKDIIPGTNLEPLILSISNGNKLTAIVQNHNYNNTAGADNSAQIVTLTITGKTSGKSKTIQLTNAAKIEFDLDDISTSGKHFNDQFGSEGLIPGEDFEAVAWLSDNSRIANPVESNHVIDNSLFNSYNRYTDSNTGNSTDVGTVIVSSIRHLENLDPTISSFSKAAQDKTGDTAVKELIAKQSADINYSDFTTACGNKIYDKNNSEITNYYGIFNDDLKEFDGTNHAIKNISSSSGNGGNSGIIGTVNRTGDNKNFSMKNVDIVDCSFSSSAGCAGSAVGLASSPIIFEYVNVKGEDTTKTSNISANMGGVNAAGGLIGKSSDTLTVNRCYISSDNMKATESIYGGIIGNNAGGIVGYAVAACTIKDSYVEGKDLNPVGNTSGGLVGKSDTSLTIEKCHVSGESLNVAGNVAGGIAGLTSGVVNISDTYSTAYVYADIESDVGTGGGIAGGFIGSIENAGSDSIIERCYVSGHTKVGNYATGTKSSRETAAHVDNFNIIANGIAGGFIGDSSETSRIIVKNSYTTASVYASNYKGITGNKIAGGFVGTSSYLSVNNVYSAGLVSATEGGKTGGFVGLGSVTAVNNTESYFLQGEDSNGNLFNVNDNELPGIKATSGEKIKVETEADAKPWDSKCGTKYTYKTVAQLSGENTPLTKHVGDWVKIIDADINGTFIRNAEKLSVVLSTKVFGKGSNVSMLVQGLSSNNYAYFPLKISSSGNAISLDTDADLSSFGDPASNLVIISNGLNSDSKALNDTDGNYEHYINLDDITTEQGNFKFKFENFYPGEDIRITVKRGLASWDTLMNAAENNLKTVKSGVTNSLFADGSNKATYKTEDYNDVNPNYAIVDPVEGVSFANTALVTNFRHLQNLDSTVALTTGTTSQDRTSFYNAFNKVKLCKDLYWKLSAAHPNAVLKDIPNIMTTAPDATGWKFTDFISTIKGMSSVDFVDIYGDSSGQALAVNDSFYGIENTNITEFDGQSHSINFIKIGSETETSNVGLFRNIAFSGNFTICNFTMNYPEITGTTGDVGAVIGNLTGNSGLTFTSSNITMNGPVVNSTSGDVGGVIGKINNGYSGVTYNVSNIIVNYPVITGTTCISAGGVIGDIIANDKLTFNASYINTLGCKVNVSSNNYGQYEYRGNSAALFGEIYVNRAKTGTNITINNITSDNSRIAGFEHAGILIGRLGGARNLGSNPDDQANATVNISNSIIKDSVAVSMRFYSEAGAVCGGFYNTGSLTMNKVYSYGKKSLIKSPGSWGAAGGLFGKAWYGTYNITNSGASSYVYAGRESAGFIGNFKPKADSTIENCFVGGHVADNYNYVGNTAVGVNAYDFSTDIVDTNAFDVGGYNIYSKYIAGGFFGYVWAGGNNSAPVITLNKCFTTASVYVGEKKAASGIDENSPLNAYNQHDEHGSCVGGFIGKLQSSWNTIFNSCYVAGRVFNSTDNANHVGGFIGMSHLVGENSAEKRPKYNDVSILRGINFNNSLIAIDVDTCNGTTTYPTDYSDSLFVNSDSSRIASENASEVKTTTFSLPEGKQYPYMDKALNHVTGDTYPYVFYGDWVEVEKLGMYIRNAETLSVVFKGSVYQNTDVSILFEGMYSEKTAFAMYNFNNRTITQYTGHQITNKLNALNRERSNIKVYSTSKPDAPEMLSAHCDANFYAKPLGGNNGYEYYIYLDDITTPSRVFDKIFDTFIPGEDVRITAKIGVWSWSNLKDYANKDPQTMCGITNSLFADGSYNDNYTYATYYQDLNPDYAIVKPVSGDSDAYKDTALITNFRHLQNLDIDVSDVNDDETHPPTGKSSLNYRKVKLCRDLYWKSSAGTVQSEVDFITAINSGKGYDVNNLHDIKLYGVDSNTENHAIAASNSFFGIRNEYLTEFDGQNHSINNVVINPVIEFNSLHDCRRCDVIYSGLIRYHDTTKSKSLYIHDLNLIEPISYASKDDAGALIGYINSDEGSLRIENINVTEPVSQAENNAGGLIGKIDYKNSSLSINNIILTDSIVYAATNTGGLIGIINNENSNVTIGNVSSYGKKSIVKSEGDLGNAGGLIGEADLGAYNITNCWTSSYVYGGTCAGGFIGDFKPKAATTIKDCIVGGHLSSYLEYIDAVAIDSILNLSNEGGYNVYCRNNLSGKPKAVGGFIGFLGSKGIAAEINFDNCFTAASVNSIPTNNYNNTVHVNKSAVGGFIGRIQAGNHKYNNCHVAGKVFENADVTGYFVGHLRNENSKFAIPVFNNDNVSQGIGFNDSNIGFVNLDKPNNVTITGINPDVYDLNSIINSGYVYY